jgi:hypothetical protein
LAAARTIFVSSPPLACCVRSSALVVFSLFVSLLCLGPLSGGPQHELGRRSHYFCEPAARHPPVVALPSTLQLPAACAFAALGTCRSQPTGSLHPPVWWQCEWHGALRRARQRGTDIGPGNACYCRGTNQYRKHMCVSASVRWGGVSYMTEYMRLVAAVSAYAGEHVAAHACGD